MSFGALSSVHPKFEYYILEHRSSIRASKMLVILTASTLMLPSINSAKGKAAVLNVCVQ